MNITILGMGAYATALSHLFINGNNITMYSKYKEEIDKVKVIHPSLNIKIDKNIQLENNLEKAIKNADIIIYAIPINAIREITIELSKYYKDSLIIVTSKGIEENTYKLPVNIISNYIKTKKIAYLAGGGFAIDIINNNPIGLTFASIYKNNYKIFKNIVSNNLNIEYTSDINGCQICSCLKNIYAIGSGIINGLGYNESTTDMYINNCIKEISNIINNKKTIFTFCCLSDLILTCTSNKSRNYTLGFLIGSKTSNKDIDKYIEDNTIEGLLSLKVFYSYLNKNNYKRYNIINSIYDIVYNKANPNIIINL